MSEFDRAVDLIIYLEGGYNDDPLDSGGATKYGISKAAFPTLNIEKITLKEAKIIYKNQYWNLVSGDKLPPATATIVFDMAVNSGVYRAKRIMQRALRVKQDGAIGPKTLKALSQMKEKDFLIKYTKVRIVFYTGLDHFDRFGAGWTSRAIDCLIACLTIEGENNG